MWGIAGCHNLPVNWAGWCERALPRVKVRPKSSLEGLGICRPDRLPVPLHHLWLASVH
jgi:hypothetical protein